MVELLDRLLEPQPGRNSDAIDILGLLGAVLPRFKRSYIIVDALDENPTFYEDILRELRKLSFRTTSLNELFKDMIDRIKSEEQKKNQKLGIRTLLWAIYASRPLTIREISQALATYRIKETGSAKLNPTSIPSPQDVIESTCYFLTVDRATSIVQTHKSVKDYCEDLGSDIEEHFGNVQFDMARICLRYLTLDDFKRFQWKVKVDWDDFLSKYPFLEYAASNWGRHMMDSGEADFTDKVIRMLQWGNVLLCIGQALQKPLRVDGLMGDRQHYAAEEFIWPELTEQEVPMPALHVLTYFGMEETAEKYLEEEEVDCLNWSKYTSLWLACRLGHTDMARLLLKGGADPTIENSEGRHCLSAAVWGGHLDVVKLLLSHKKREKTSEKLLRQVNWFGRSVFADAAILGRVEVLQVLLSYVATMHDRSELLLKADHSGLGVLFEAAANNEAAVIRLLMRQPEGPQLLVQQTDYWKDHPLHIAAVKAHHDALEALVRAGASLAVKQSQGRTPLRLACQLPGVTHRSIVSWLLNHGADPRIRDLEERTALHAAADHGRPENVRELLKFQIDDMLEAKDFRGRTPYRAAWEAAKPGYEDVIRILSKPPRVLRSSIAGEAMAVANNPISYLRSESIPEDMQLPIPRVQFEVESHDQGWADDFPWNNGTYSNSNTWFVVCHNSKDDKEIQRLMLTRNIRAKADKHLYNISWDVDGGDLGGGSRPKDDTAQEEVKGFLRRINHGDYLTLVAEAVYPGWVNYVQSASMTVYVDK